MHELAVTQGILDLVLETAQQHGARRITVIDLVVGELSSIVDDSVQFYFDILSQGTPAQEAKLSFRRKPAHVVCWDCGHQLVPASLCSQSVPPVAAVAYA
jgi:hydrogenase nickel incorporation protein HypA/HybF